MSSRVVIPVLASLEQNDKPMVKQVIKGIKQLQHQSIASQSHSSTQTTFNFQPPSQNTVIDRRFELEMDVRFETNLATVRGIQKISANDISRTGGGQAPADALRQTCNFKRASSRLPKKNTSFQTILGTVPQSQLATDGTPAAIKVALDQTIGGINAAIVDAINLPDNLVAPAATDCGTSGVDSQIGNNLAPRQFPLTSCMDSIDLVINGTHFSVSVNQYIHAVMTYTTPEWRDKNLPQTPHAPDVVGKYLDQNMVATSNNPLSLLGESFRKGEEPRGAHLSQAYPVANTAGVASNGLEFKLREPLFISPLMAMLGHGITNINQIDITIRWSSDISRIFSYAVMSGLKIGDGSFPFSDPADPLGDGASATAVASANAIYPIESTMSAVFPTKQAFLNVLYYTPMDDVNIPNEIILPYKQPQIEIVSVTGGTGNDLTQKMTATGNNVRLNQIPECVYLYVKQRHGSLGVQNPDNHARITKVSVQWKNQTNILSGYNEKDLIEMACYNGYDSDIAEVLNGKGLVLKLNFGQDLPLDDNESAGTRGDYNWRCDVDVWPNTLIGQKGVDANNDLVFYQVFVMNGHAIISPNECRVSTGVLSLEDNMGAEDLGHTYEPNASSVAGGSAIGGSVVGGSLIGGATSHLKQVVDMGRSALGVARKVGKVGQCVGDAVKSYQSRS